MRLWALSDLHVGYPKNRQFIQNIEGNGEDWLVLGGDLGETLGHLEFVLETLCPRFAKTIWIPGNHELWSVPERDGGPGTKGEEKYRALVELCHRYGVLTPQDEFPIWPGDGGPKLICPLFVLYDYSFRPSHVAREDALGWAKESGVECMDEHLLLPDPYDSREAWCDARIRYSEKRLEEALAAHSLPTVLINHFPLRQELAVLPLVPRFTLWCGTTRTEEWHRRFNAEVVVFGHLHIRQTRVIDGVRFEEVSLGYPGQWRDSRDATSYLRQVLPSSSHR